MKKLRFSNDDIRSILIMYSIFFFISGIVWTFVEPGNRWLWFSRMGLALILLGISACIKTDKQ